MDGSLGDASTVGSGGGHGQIVSPVSVEVADGERSPEEVTRARFSPEVTRRQDEAPARIQSLAGASDDVNHPSVEGASEVFAGGAEGQICESVGVEVSEDDGCPEAVAGFGSLSESALGEGDGAAGTSAGAEDDGDHACGVERRDRLRRCSYGEITEAVAVEVAASFVSVACRGSDRC
jgi:hypothetical protein